MGRTRWFVGHERGKRVWTGVGVPVNGIHSLASGSLTWTHSISVPA